MSNEPFDFEGRPVPFRDGQSIAAALTEAGLRTLRRTTQGADRGVFCGMGVCQDCLVTIDNVPNRRACMTSAVPGIVVKPQDPLPQLDPQAPLPTPAAPLRLAPDVLVIGGGGGGLSAAIAARQAGASVVLLDERKVPGGQYYKQAAAAGPLDRQQAEGLRLVEEARASGAEILPGTEVWGAFDGPLILAELEGAAVVVRPRTLIVATGAYERPRMVPGWTLPGVTTTGAAQTLWRSYRTLPGRRVLVCGSGPLNLQVALELAQAGATVMAVAELAPSPFTRPVGGLSLALAGPALWARGLRMVAALRQIGVPVLNRTELSRIERGQGGLRAHLTDAGGRERSFDLDAVLMNEGFEPQNEILRLLGAAVDYDPLFGHLRCRRSERMETTVPGLYAVGDCAGLGGAPAAVVEGRIAGRAAAAVCGLGDAHDLFAEQRILARHRRFQRRLWSLYEPRPRSLAAAPDETIVCRCEEITLAQVRAGLAEGPTHSGTLKRATRLGMGRCQGRYCGPVAARIVAEATGSPLEDQSHFAPRVPIKPIDIGAILAAQGALDDTA